VKKSDLSVKKSDSSVKKSDSSVKKSSSSVKKSTFFHARFILLGLLLVAAFNFVAGILLLLSPPLRRGLLQWDMHPSSSVSSKLTFVIFLLKALMVDNLSTDIRRQHLTTLPVWGHLSVVAH
jgi:hypothetical protein